MGFCRYLKQKILILSESNSHAVAFTKKETHTHPDFGPPFIVRCVLRVQPVYSCVYRNHTQPYRHAQTHSHTLTYTQTHTFIFVRAHTSQLRIYIHAYSHTHCTNAVQESAPHACKLRARAPHSNALSLSLTLTPHIGSAPLSQGLVP